MAPFDHTIRVVRETLLETFAQVDSWFDRPEDLRRFHPAGGGWTADEVLEHITLTSFFLLKVIRKSAGRAIQRARNGRTLPYAESNLAMIDPVGEAGAFRWARPEHMEPTGNPASAEIRRLMAEQRDECLSLLASMPEGEGSLVFVQMSVNGCGKIDVYQWIYFLALHAKRHLTQLQRIDADYRAAQSLGQ